MIKREIDADGLLNIVKSSLFALSFYPIPPKWVMLLNILGLIVINYLYEIVDIEHGLDWKYSEVQLLSSEDILRSIILGP